MSQVNSFPCDYCGMSYSHLTDKMEHVKRRHKDQVLGFKKEDNLFEYKKPHQRNEIVKRHSFSEGLLEPGQGTFDQMLKIKKVKCKRKDCNQEFYKEEIDYHNKVMHTKKEMVKFRN